jgi:hypothetical protein
MIFINLVRCFVVIPTPPKIRRICGRESLVVLQTMPCSCTLHLIVVFVRRHAFAEVVVLRRE